MRRLFNVFLIIISLLCQEVVFVQASDDSNQEIIYSEKEQEVFGVLEALGIYTKDDSTINSLITRGEFAELALKFTGYSALEIAQTESVLRFPDIVQSDSRAAVSLAAELGYVNGYDDGYFYPDNYISISEARTIIYNVLGYNANSEHKISDGNISNGVLTEAGGVLTHRAAARLLFNALECRVMGRNFSDTVSYSYADTALYNFFDVKIVTGIVNANSTTSLMSKAGCPDGYVVIGSEEYKDEGQLAWGMLGYDVKGYYREGSDENELIYVFQRKNEVLQVNADDILSETNEKTFNYLVSDRKKSFNLSPVIRVIYNYTLAVPFTADMLTPSSGEAVFVDNDHDNIYDVLFINEYRDYYVSGVDAENGIIYDKYAKNNVEIDDKLCDIFKNDKKVDFSTINVGDVVSVYQSENYLRMIVSTKSVKGAVAAVDFEDEQRIISIDSENYYTSFDYENALTSGCAKAIRIKDSGTFYLNEWGKIVAFTAEDVGLKYGFLTRIYLSDEDEIYIRLIDSTGEKCNYKLYEKARVTVGQTVYRLNKADLQSLVSEISADRLIKYELGEDGLISKMYISDGTVVADFSKDSEDTLNLNKHILNGYYNAESTLADSDWYCGDGTIIFGIPMDTDGNIIYDEIVVLDGTSVISSSYEMRVYDSNEYKIPSAVVIYNANRNQDARLYYNYKSFILVTRKHNAVNEDSEILTVLDGYYMGKPVSYSTTDSSIFKDFEPGDVGQVVMNNGKVYTARVLYKNKEISQSDYTDKKLTYKNTLHKRDVQNYGLGIADSSTIYTNKTSEFMLVHARVLDVTSNYISVQYRSDEMDTATAPNKGCTVLTYPIKSWTRIYKVSEGKEIQVTGSDIRNMRKSSSFGIVNGTRVLMNVRAQRVDEIFIFDDESEL